MYSDRKIVSWTFTNKTISSAGTVSIIKMPDGYRGVFVGCEFYAVTGVTVAADTIYLGSTSDTDAYGTASIPVTPTGSAASVTNTRPTSSGDKGEAQYTEVPDGTSVIIITDHACTAGAGDLTVHFECWKG